MKSFKLKWQQNIWQLFQQEINQSFSIQEGYAKQLVCLKIKLNALEDLHVQIKKHKDRKEHKETIILELIKLNVAEVPKKIVMDIVTIGDEINKFLKQEGQLQVEINELNRSISEFETISRVKTLCYFDLLSKTGMIKENQFSFMDKYKNKLF